MIYRTVSPLIQEYLAEKIILLSGPRQVGKTFLSKVLTKKYQYLNFDMGEDKKMILTKTWERDGNLLILDELHKFKKWKNWIKGIYDTEKGKNKFLITGSARLDVFRKSGESLAGRHISIRLLPLSLREINSKNHLQAIQNMLKRGSFPEPYLSNSDRKAAIWRKSHLDAILREDLAFTDSVKDLNTIYLLIELLRERVGQQIVYQNLANDLEVSPITVKRWIHILESLFIVFVVYPYTKNVAEAVKKEPKIYFYDIGQVSTDEGHHLENLVALHLLKRNFFLEDTQGKKMRLCYIRDKKKREIDFAIEENNRLTHLIEVKTSDDSFNTNLNYYSKRLKPIQSIHLVLNLKRNKDHETYKVRNLGDFLFNLET